MMTINKINNYSHYYLPAEWQKQVAVQLTWPHNKTDWVNIDPNLDKINNYFIQLAENILNYQDLIIAADNHELKQFISSKLNKNYKFKYNIYIANSNDTWARDHGPICLIDNNNNKLVLDFEFNAWGGKFDASKDNLITSKLFQQQAFDSNNNKINYEKINYILEGGAIDSNGIGTVLTTSSCILNNNRNNKYSNRENIDFIKQYLNIKNLIILENSFLEGDDTDGHIDMLARFCTSSTIIYTACDNKNHPNYVSLNKLEQELKDLQNNLLKNIKLVPLYIPDQPIISNIDNQSILPGSYANFLIINNAVLLPTYGNKKYDQLAVDTLANIFTDRKIIPINSLIAIEQGGSLHCLTMQIPE